MCQSRAHANNLTADRHQVGCKEEIVILGLVKFGLAVGELCCFMGHVKAWRKQVFSVRVG